MSGTPINNPDEIYDLCNLLYDEKLKFFTEKENRKKEIQDTLKGNQENIIKELFK